MQSTEQKHEHMPVKIAIAMSESGRFKVCIAESNWIQEEQKHKQMLDEIRQDRQAALVAEIHNHKRTVPSFFGD